MNYGYDVVILGAGGAGLMCALQAGRRGLGVVVLDHAETVGGKILISGGGRCNFTNLEALPINYVSQNEHFCKSALSRYLPQDFIAMVEDHEIPYHEKKLGQLFCDRSARDIVAMLKTECDKVGVDIRLSCKIEDVRRAPVAENETGFLIETNMGIFSGTSLVVATGGLSIPKIGATGIGYKIARDFGLKVTETKPALDGFVFSSADTTQYKELAGLSVDTIITIHGKSFRENVLFTHVGLSGPAALQASLHWNAGDAIEINFLPDVKILDHLLKRKSDGHRVLLKTALGEFLPNRLADQLCAQKLPENPGLHQINEKALAAFCNELEHWTLTPRGTVGYSKAEVTRGGVDTTELSSKTMESKKVPGLYFIGEVVDVTGWLGGYNFQWAWASGWAAAQSFPFEADTVTSEL